jgi:hypothetical protein
VKAASAAFAADPKLAFLSGTASTATTRAARALRAGATASVATTVAVFSWLFGGSAGATLACSALPASTAASGHDQPVLG